MVRLKIFPKPAKQDADCLGGVLTETETDGGIKQAADRNRQHAGLSMLLYYLQPSGRLAGLVLRKPRPRI